MTAPPDYTEANRQLQPDIGTLPKINNIALENAVEGTIENIGHLLYYFLSYSKNRTYISNRITKTSSSG